MKIRGQKVHSIQERLNRLSVLNSTTGCIEWSGSMRNGYGRIMTGSRTDGSRKSVSAHRMAYELKFGEIPDNNEVCHKCDNPKCINPDHLFLGTRQDNINDREHKGRNNHTRKLSPDDVIEIRRNRGVLGSKVLSKKFGVTHWTIKDVWRGRLYPQPPASEG